MTLPVKVTSAPRLDNSARVGLAEDREMLGVHMRIVFLSRQHRFQLQEAQLAWPRLLSFERSSATTETRAVALSLVTLAVKVLAHRHSGVGGPSIH